MNWSPSVAGQWNAATLRWNGRPSELGPDQMSTLIRSLQFQLVSRRGVLSHSGQEAPVEWVVRLGMQLRVVGDDFVSLNVDCLEGL
jgi:hypothetical protein